MFLPVTTEEIKKLGWERPDVILVSGDTYIDSPYDGIAVIGKVLMKSGYRVAVIAQPDVSGPEDITRFGEPALFWGVSGGCVDSMVANYTALNKKKKKDDLTPGGLNDRRPDRAVIIYTNLIRRFYKGSKPIILGGIEASLRRITHYDYPGDKLRKPVIFDAKADAIVYGMGEKAITEIAEKLKNGLEITDVRGTCHIARETKPDFIELPSFDEVAGDKTKFNGMFSIFYNNNDPLNAKGLVQKIDGRYLVQNPPQPHLTQKELDDIYALDFEYDVHPYYKKQGRVKALETIQFSVNSHRGCYGECNFCAITVHQGRTIISRSEASMIKEVKKMAKHPDFKGIISDVGGPTANMYGNSCEVQLKKGSCKKKRCAFPAACKKMDISHAGQISLLEKLRSVPGVKKVFIGSGVRYDLVIEDKDHGRKYLMEIAEHHVSGQMKVAPEHTDDTVLAFMGKPSNNKLARFRDDFLRISKNAGKKQFLTYYFIAAHPGCSLENMRSLKEFIKKELKVRPEQVQIFTPTPSTYATAMYYTGMNPFTGEKMFVEKGLRNKSIQKDIITGKRLK